MAKHLKNKQILWFVAILLISTELLPVHIHFVSEDLVPFLSLFIFLLAGCSVFLLVWMIQHWLPFVIASFLLLILCSSLKTIFEQRKGIKKPLYHSIPYHFITITGRLITRLAKVITLFICIGFILFGFLVKPNYTSVAILAGLIIRGLWIGFVYQFLDGKYTPRIVQNGFFIWSIVACILLVLYLGHWKVNHIIYLVLFFFGTTGFFISMFREKSRETRFAIVVRDVCVYSLIAGLFVLVGFTYEIFTSKPDLGQLRRIGTIEGIYDLKFDADSNRLYFTSNRHGTGAVGYINTNTGETLLKDFPGFALRRFAIAPGQNRIFVSSLSNPSSNSSDTVVEMTFDSLDYLGDIFNRASTDMKVIHERTLFICCEAEPEITSIDINSKQKKIITLPGFYSWPYSLQFSPELESLYVSNWIVSPYIHRIDTKSFKKQKRVNGFLNMGLCILPEQMQLYIARPFHRRVDIVDPTTLEGLGTIALEFGLREIVCDKERYQLFTTTFFRGILQVVDLHTKEVILQTKVGPFPRALSYDTENKILYVGSKSGIYALDLKENTGRKAISM